VISFFFFNDGKQECKTGPVWWVSTSGRGEDARKGCRRVNMVEILFTYVCKWKNEKLF
jgi:hypothetical protein